MRSVNDPNTSPTPHSTFPQYQLVVNVTLLLMDEVVYEEKDEEEVEEQWRMKGGWKLIVFTFSTSLRICLFKLNFNIIVMNCRRVLTQGTYTMLYLPTRKR